MALQRARITMLGIHHSMIEGRFAEVESFIHNSRRGMKATWDEFTDKFNQRTAGWGEDRIREYTEGMLEDIVMLRDATPQLMRQSHCMIVYGTFEASVVNLCRAVHRDHKIGNPPRVQMYIDDVRAYLRPHVPMKPRPFGHEWDWMSDFRIIRNRMAHDDGNLDARYVKPGHLVVANKFIRRNKSLIKATRFGELALEDKLIDRAVEKAKRAIAKIEKAVWTLYP